jgi:DNA-binding transcriptional ArsR family regulator
MKQSSLDHAVTIARALGHPARLRTVAMLRSGELCVCQITAVLELAPSTVSAHLRELRRAGLTTERKEGRWVWVGLCEDPGIRPWIDNALAATSGDGQMLSDLDLVEEIQTLPVEDLCRLGYEVAREKRRSKIDAALSKDGNSP